MKSIAIVTRCFNTGGIEKALINMLKNIDYNQFSVDLYIVEAGGELECEIPKEVNKIYMFPNTIKKRLTDSLLNCEIKKCISLIKFCMACYKNESVFNKNKSLLNTLERVSKAYDVAIGYHSLLSICNMFVADKLYANKKVMWVHSDINDDLDVVDSYLNYYESFNKIFCVSNGSMNNFVKKYPNLKTNCEVFLNSISKQEIINYSKVKQNEKFFNEEVTALKILTVGRLSYEKGIDLVPKIAKELQKRNIEFKWLILGQGGEQTRISSIIKQYNLNNNVILYGNASNPYPAMRECDIYVQPSRFEAWGITITEAKCLEKPIIASDIVGINDQIEHKFNGLLCERDEIQFADAIIELIKNKKLMQEIIHNLSKENIDTRDEVQKIYKMI